MRDASAEVISKTDNLAVVNFPEQDTDRMRSFFQVAQQTERALVINLKQAYLLKLFEESGIVAPKIDDELSDIHSTGKKGSRRPVC